MIMFLCMCGCVFGFSVCVLSVCLSVCLCDALCGFVLFVCVGEREECVCLTCLFSQGSGHQHRKNSAKVPSHTGHVDCDVGL